MPAESTQSYRDWFKHGESDLLSANILVKNNGPAENVAFSLQQAAEKYLKGYLLSKGWKLKRIHDLEVLVSEAITHNKRFESFLDYARVISGVYVESRYPSGPPREYSVDQVSDWLIQTERLVALIKEAAD
jgi:HEPN domain-containing protein